MVAKSILRTHFMSPVILQKDSIKWVVIDFIDLEKAPSALMVLRLSES